jgi:hypothetical protein
MNEEIKTMSKMIRIITLVETLTAVLISFLLGFNLKVAIGIIAGAMIGIIGFSMIVLMSETITQNPNPKGKAFRSYLLRFIFYGCLFALFMVRGVPVLALFVGMLCHKSSMYIYTFMKRKED